MTCFGRANGQKRVSGLQIRMRAAAICLKESACFAKRLGGRACSWTRFSLLRRIELDHLVPLTGAIPGLSRMAAVRRGILYAPAEMPNQLDLRLEIKVFWIFSWNSYFQYLPSPMKLLTTFASLAVLTAVLPAPVRAAESVVFEIGAIDNSNADFEQETDAYNNPRYYTGPGDYSLTSGGSGPGIDYPGPGAEILQDGPVGLVDPNDPGSGQVWALSNEGFPRAVVPGRPVVDVFFQLTAEEVNSSALLFETTLFGLGANSSHDLTFYLNNVAFARRVRVRGTTPLQLYIPHNIPGMVFQEGPNVLTIRRTGGGLVDPLGVDNPWIQFDALKLTAGVTDPAELILQVGYFDNTQADFEQERDDYNNPQFYAVPGDYSAIRGMAGPGGNFTGADAEIWKDPDDDGLGSPDGFPRAMVPGRPAIDIYFKLTEAQAQSDFLKFHTILFAQGANSTHDIRAYLNGTPVAIGQNLTHDTQVDVTIPRLNAVSPGYGPAFHSGGNVLSLVRTGGGPIDPDAGDNPWMQVDAVSITRAETPADVTGLEAFRTVFSVGYFNGNANEFEQESGAFNNPQFYAAPGDYTNTAGRAGNGGIWEGPGAEIWQDGKDAATWPTSQDGFPRALIKADWGRPIIDIFFQEQEAAGAKAYLFTTKLFGLGPDSSHDLEFLINGKSFYTGTEITKDTYVSALIPAEAVLPGPNVISLQRTGGLNTDTAWIQFDQVELISQAETLTLPSDLPAFGITSISVGGTGQVTLSWESVNGGVYRVQTSPSMLADTWTNASGPITATGASTSYTDTPAPAGTKVRFYRVLRQQ